MKRFLQIVLGLCALGLVWSLLANTWDIGNRCARCLYHEVHLQHRFAGITFWTSKREGSDRYAQTYRELFQKPCTHVLKTAGFGHNPGCGMTAEGGVFMGRNAAVEAIFETHRRHPNPVLARASLALVEQLFPEQTTVENYYRHRNEEGYTPHVGNMFLYSEWMELVETNEEWTQVNEAARQNFVTLPPLLRDKKSLQAKTTSSSPVVRQAAATALEYPPRPE
jgi:hypothetical protein